MYTSPDLHDVERSREAAAMDDRAGWKELGAGWLTCIVDVAAAQERDLLFSRMIDDSELEIATVDDK